MASIITDFDSLPITLQTSIKQQMNLLFQEIHAMKLLHMISFTYMYHANVNNKNLYFNTFIFDITVSNYIQIEKWKPIGRPTLQK